MYITNGTIRYKPIRVGNTWVHTYIIDPANVLTYTDNKILCYTRTPAQTGPHVFNGTLAVLSLVAETTIQRLL